MHKKKAQAWADTMADDKGDLALYTEAFLELLTDELLSAIADSYLFTLVNNDENFEYGFHIVNIIASELRMILQVLKASDFNFIRLPKRYDGIVSALKSSHFALSCNSRLYNILDDTDSASCRRFYAPNTYFAEPSQVTADNLRTVQEVLNWTLMSSSRELVSRVSEVERIVSRLFEIPENRDVSIDGKKFQLNPFGMTNLQLLAQGHFGSIGEILGRKYNGGIYAYAVQPDSEDFLDPEFLIQWTRLLEPDKRHGGCPANHPQFRERDLINRLGRKYLQVITMIQQKIEPEAEKDSTKGLGV